MWHNYRKPRPLKLGAFRFAARENAPVLPMFITLEDTDRVGADGFLIQEYTVNILPAIFPNENKNVRQNAEYMCVKNYDLWKETYESFYGKELEYLTEKKVEICSI